MGVVLFVASLYLPLIKRVLKNLKSENSFAEGKQNGARQKIARFNSDLIHRQYIDIKEIKKYAFLNKCVPGVL